MTPRPDPEAAVSSFDRFHCRACAVVFREPFPAYYDVTPCPACRRDARNVGLSAGAGPTDRWSIDGRTSPA